jgi:hypothetical protein
MFMKKEKKARISTYLIFIGVFLIAFSLVSSLVSGSFEMALIESGVFESCDSLVGLHGTWGADYGDLLVDTSNKVEGTGSIKDVISAGEWTEYLHISTTYGNYWDISQNPILTFEFYTTNLNYPIRVNLITAELPSEWVGHTWVINSQLTLNTWSTVTLDFSSASLDGSYADLTLGRRITISVNENAVGQLPQMSINVDNLRFSGSTSPTPTPVPTPTPSSTSTPVPTPTPSSTSTPVPTPTPSWTPDQTALPIVSPTVQPTGNAQEESQLNYSKIGFIVGAVMAVVGSVLRIKKIG